MRRVPPAPRRNVRYLWGKEAMTRRDELSALIARVESAGVGEERELLAAGDKIELEKCDDAS